MQKRILNYWKDKSLWVALLYTLFILMMSLVNSASISIKGFTLSDKILHLSAYFILMWVWMMYFKKKSIEQKDFLLLLILTYFGIIIEFLQKYFTLTRTQDLNDVVANGIGLIIGLVTFKIFIERVFKSKNTL